MVKKVGQRKKKAIKNVVKGEEENATTKCQSRRQQRDRKILLHLQLLEDSSRYWQQPTECDRLVQFSKGEKKKKVKTLSLSHTNRTQPVRKRLIVPFQSNWALLHMVVVIGWLDVPLTHFLTVIQGSLFLLRVRVPVLCWIPFTVWGCGLLAQHPVDPLANSHIFASEGYLDVLSRFLVVLDLNLGVNKL